MTKGSIFNKISDVLTVSAFKNIFQKRRSSEVLLPDVPKDGRIQKYMRHCHGASRDVHIG